VSSRGCRWSASSAEEFVAQPEDPANGGRVDRRQLVPSGSDGSGLYCGHGFVHQMLCRAHAQFQSEEATSSSNQRNSKSTHEHVA